MKLDILPVRRRIVLAGAIVGATLLGGGVAAAAGAIPGANGTIQGCYNNATGVLRVVSDSSQCLTSGPLVTRTPALKETPITWSQTGPQGAAGLAGAAGQKGDTGGIGPMGPMGPKGDEGAAGAPGAKGESGAKGDMGPQGDIGPTGPQGLQGVQGAPGLSGYEVYKEAATVTKGQVLSKEVACPAGKSPLSGGVSISPLLTNPSDV